MNDQILYPYPDEDLAAIAGRKAISYYRQTTGDEDGVLELMIHYLERGTQYTVDYGDMWESFYDDLSEMGFEIVEEIKKKNPGSDFLETIEPRFREIGDLSRNIGWGFGDDMAEIYSALFNATG